MTGLIAYRPTSVFVSAGRYADFHHGGMDTRPGLQRLSPPAT